MKRVSYFLGLLTYFSTLSAVDVEIDEKLDQDEIRILRDWVNTKRQMSIEEREKNLSISGEVRTEYQSRKEIRNGRKQLGQGGAFPNKPSDQYDIEVNLMVDYRLSRVWASSKLEYDNNMGTSSGTFGNISLERAYLGGRLVDADTFTIDAEAGRRNFGNVFDSLLQFGSFMDGFVVKYDQGLDFLGDAYLHAGPFIINENNNQYGYVGEIGVLNFWGTGLYTKYSLIDWDTKHFDDEVTFTRSAFTGGNPENIRWQFLVSQLTLGYRIKPQWLDRTVTLYAAGLLNSAAKPYPTTANKKANYGYYAGLSIGKLRQKGDWSFDANYQVLAAQGVPLADVSGIGVGNTTGSGLHTVNKDGSGGFNDLANAGGRTNYKGYGAQFLYLIAPNVTLYQSWSQSWTLDKQIGPGITFNQYEIEIIFAF